MLINKQTKCRVFLQAVERNWKRKTERKKDRQTDRQTDNDSNLILSFGCIGKPDFDPRVENETRKTKNNENLY